MQMKVSKETHPKKIAGAIFNALQENPQIELICIGAASLNNCMKALIVAKGYFAERHEKIQLDPFFTDTTVPDKGEIVAISIIVRKTKRP